jgi:HSP20 family molecular chaperone IbpA
MSKQLAKLPNGDWLGNWSLPGLPRLYERGGLFKLFDDVFSNTIESWDYSPVDLYETKTDLIAEVAIPGIPQSKWDIEIIDNVLKISASDEQEEKDEDITYHIKSWTRSNKHFSTAVSLPTSVDTTISKAVYKYGVLKITMPKTNSVESTKIQVETEGED